MNVSNDAGLQLKRYIENFLKDIGLSSKNLDIQPLAGDGSTRMFFRIRTSETNLTHIIMKNPPKADFESRENYAYLRIGEHLFQRGLPVPKMIRSDLKNGWFIMEDMGDDSLQQLASQEKDRVQLYEDTAFTLFKLQVEGCRDFDPAWVCQTERYDKTVMRRYESNYFRDAYLGTYLGLKGEWHELEAPFEYLADMASLAENRFFLHRDFQSRNIFFKEKKIGILDWQGARFGPLAYDLASLLIDPYTNLSGPERDHLLAFYLKLLDGYRPKSVDVVKRSFPYLALQRNLQIIGAFSFLSKVGHKPYFEAYIPTALKTLSELLETFNDPKLSVLSDLAKNLLERTQ